MFWAIFRQSHSNIRTGSLIFTLGLLVHCLIFTVAEFDGFYYFTSAMAVDCLIIYFLTRIKPLERLFYFLMLLCFASISINMAGFFAWTTGLVVAVHYETLILILNITAGGLMHLNAGKTRPKYADLCDGGER